MEIFHPITMTSNEAALLRISYTSEELSDIASALTRIQDVAPHSVINLAYDLWHISDKKYLIALD